MDSNLRKGWTEIITADDIDRHLKDIGQAEANSNLISEMLSTFPPKQRSKLLVAGAGTGQMFDFFSLTLLSGHNLTFTDINLSYLERLTKRLERNLKEFQYEIIIDDLECSQLSGPFDAALIVLVLEHIDWRRGVDSLVRFQSEHLYFVIQRNEPGSETVNTKRELAPTIKEFAKIAKPTLVEQKELETYLLSLGYQVVRTLERPVPDSKTMIGLVARKRP